MKRLIVVYFDGRKGNHNLGGTWCRACVHDVCVGSMLVKNMDQARCRSSAIPLSCQGARGSERLVIVVTFRTHNGDTCSGCALVALSPSYTRLAHAWESISGVD